MMKVYGRNINKEGKRNCTYIYIFFFALVDPKTKKGYRGVGGFKCFWRRE